jgi:hypothetical protein
VGHLTLSELCEHSTQSSLLRKMLYSFIALWGQMHKKSY